MQKHSVGAVFGSSKDDGTCENLIEALIGQSRTILNDA
jgi:hypothetical protein